MAGRGNKRRLEDFDPNKSDSDDGDYGAQPSPRPHTNRSTSQRKRKSDHQSSRKPAAKRQRKETYGDSQDDIESDSQDATSSGEGSFAADDEEARPVERNPKTGRVVRGAAKKGVKYEETSDDDIVSTRDSTPDRPVLVSSSSVLHPGPPKKTLIVKLSLSRQTLAEMESGGRPTRSKVGGKSISMAKRQPTPGTSSAMGTRRSSRISHDEEAPLIALTDSGRHAQVTRAGSATPEPTTAARRATRGGKGPIKKNVSAIMEESQEDAQSQLGPELFSQLQEEANKQNAEAERTSPGAENTDSNDDEEKIAMEIVQESQEDDDEDMPVARGGRSLRQRRKASSPPASQQTTKDTRRRSQRPKKAAGEPSSDFEPDADAEVADDENVSSEDEISKPRPRPGSSNSESQGGRRSGRISAMNARSQGSKRGRSDDDADEELDLDEVADEAADLEEDKRRNARPRKRRIANDEISFEPSLRRRDKRPDYRVWRPELALNDEEDAAPANAATPQRNRRGGAGTSYRSLFSTYGPFGGAGVPPPVFGGLGGQAAAGGADSDSSDDEGMAKGAAPNMGGISGMTPTSAYPKPFVPQGISNDALTGPGGGPVSMGKVKDKKALADVDPLGIDPNVSFDAVGGLDDHVDRLKEMVALPLLYPEVFQRFHVTPPRGVLFHGPPGTGKTLLARALANSVSANGQKVTFYMRKGADVLSKWVGEAEKQLRLLFEEARKNQPSIIFFDEIDGLAPVRSSKQEQIHSTIVATLLALMDGMDGRGQVIVIGATNRPDSVDPALRRPGRFDREFYFPLPSQPARRAIIDIHTKGWEPPLKPEFKDSLAEITKGYGGADLRALCTEATLNAVQGTYPQIYSSDKKLVIDPSTIKVMAKDFMLSVNKMVPSSERSAASGAVPLKKDIQPLLNTTLEKLTKIVDTAIPRKRKATALEEALYDDREDEYGFDKEMMQRQFEGARVFRPRLLIKGYHGMGQRELAGALLSKVEGLHVQNMGLSTLMSDSSRSPEAAVIQLFEEVKRHKPSVIYIPDVDIWYDTLGDHVKRTFVGLLNGIAPTEPVLLLGYMSLREQNGQPDPAMVRDLFGYSPKNQYALLEPGNLERTEFFKQVIDMVRRSPAQLPAGESRKKRKLDVLPVAQMAAPAGPSKADVKAQKKKDRQTLNALKLLIQPVMDQIRMKQKKFRTGVVDDSHIIYLYDEDDPMVLTTDLNEEQHAQQALDRPFEKSLDEKGVQGLRETQTGKFYYNLNTVVIEQRLSNGYYKRPRDYLGDIKRLAKDAKTIGDADRTLRANELLANVEVDMASIEQQYPALIEACNAVYEREQERAREQARKNFEAAQGGAEVPRIIPNVPPEGASKTTTETSGPVMLGQEIPGPRQLFPVTPSRLSGPSPVSNAWSTTNGHSHATNGSTVPSRMPPHEDSEMLDQGSPASYLPPQHRVPDPNNPASQNLSQQPQLSQKSARTHLAQNSQPSQYANSASTTTSGQKTSDRSNRSSGPFSVNTQLSNGAPRSADHPDYSTLAPASGGSQLPDTQEEHFSGSQLSQASQEMPPPATAPPKASAIHGFLNEQPAPPQPQLILDEPTLANLHAELVKRSSGLSVEQLEQVYACLMGVLWRTRGEWNRDRVCREVTEGFNGIVAEIMACQRVGGASQDD
nr:hypothetical protein B0A51_17982 [Rachicladosporium sp. CCFEE 5018]